MRRPGLERQRGDREIVRFTAATAGEHARQVDDGNAVSEGNPTPTGRIRIRASQNRLCWVGGGVLVRAAHRISRLWFTCERHRFASKNTLGRSTDTPDNLVISPKVGPPPHTRVRLCRSACNLRAECREYRRDLRWGNSTRNTGSKIKIQPHSTSLRRESNHHHTQCRCAPYYPESTMEKSSKGSLRSTYSRPKHLDACRHGVAAQPVASRHPGA